MFFMHSSAKGLTTTSPPNYNNRPNCMFVSFPGLFGGRNYIVVILCFPGT